MYAYVYTWYLPNKVWPHHHYDVHVFVCIWLCIMFMLLTYVYDVITSKGASISSWRHDMKSKAFHDVKKCAMTSKRGHGINKLHRQKHVFMSKTRYDVKRFVMTSKMRQVFRNKVKKTLWYQKVCQKYAITSKKVAITSKTCYDIKEFAITSETRLHYILFPK